MVSNPANVVLAGKLVYVALQVLGANLVEEVVMGALQGRPEALYAVCVALFTYSETLWEPLI